MKDVEVSYAFTVSPEEIERHLTPRSIVEYQGTFEVRAVEETADGWEITVESERMGPDSRSVLEFTETESGYAYEQTDGGVFESLRTEITIDDDGEAIDADEDRDEYTWVTAQSSFSFGGTFRFIKDWFGASPRKKELERLFLNLANDLESASESEDGRSET